jgi:hypothetical protein
LLQALPIDPDQEIALAKVPVPVSGGKTDGRSALRPRRSWAPWVSIVLAASILLLLGLYLQRDLAMRQALAAVAHSISAAEAEIPRHYRIMVEMESTRQWASSIVECDLYVLGNRHYALRHPALLGSGNLWIGRNGDEAWVVPARGPVRIGDETALSRWLEGNEELTTPYLHVTSLLQRLERGYRLQERSDATLTSPIQSTSLGKALSVDREGSRVDHQALNSSSAPQRAQSTDPATLQPSYRRISGQRINQQNLQIPESIELWCDRETGVAVRITATWSPGSPRGRRHLVVDLVGQAPIDTEIFDYRKHIDGRRLFLKFD